MTKSIPTFIRQMKSAPPKKVFKRNYKDLSITELSRSIIEEMNDDECEDFLSKVVCLDEKLIKRAQKLVSGVEIDLNATLKDENN